MQSPSHRDPLNTVMEAVDGSRPATPGFELHHRPLSAGSGGLIVRPSSAAASKRSTALNTRDAWGSPELQKESLGKSVSPTHAHMSNTKLRNHAHAIMARRSKEEMAQDVCLLQNAMKECEGRERKLLTEKQRLETELRKALQASSINKSMFDPCASRAPTLAEQTSMVAKPEPALINSLKDANRQLRAARDELANELSALQQSTRATRASELESEARMYLEEMDRQKKIASLMEERLKHCQSALAEAQMEINKKSASSRHNGGALSLASTVYGTDEVPAAAKGKVAVDNEAAPRSLRQELQMATIQAGRGLTGGSKELRATLASMQSAHRLLVAEAAALRNFLPEGCSWADLDPQRWKQAGVSPRGASAILRFLRTHEVRLHGELSGLPGAKRKNKDVKPPAELEGPDYHILGKDGARSSVGGPKTPTQKAKSVPSQPTKMPIDEEAEMAWKAEAARLRKQMDDHMQNLHSLVEEDSVLGDLGRSSLSMASASPYTSTNHLPTPPPSGMLRSQVENGFGAPADEVSMVSIEEHISKSVGQGNSTMIGANLSAESSHVDTRTLGHQAEFDKACKEAEDLRLKMQAAEEEFQHRDIDPVSNTIEAGGIPPIAIPPFSQLSVESDFPRVDSSIPANFEPMPPLNETSQTSARNQEEEEDNGYKYDDDDDGFEDEWCGEVSADGRAAQAPLAGDEPNGAVMNTLEGGKSINSMENSMEVDAAYLDSTASKRDSRDETEVIYSPDTNKALGRNNGYAGEPALTPGDAQTENLGGSVLSSHDNTQEPGLEGEHIVLPSEVDAPIITDHVAGFGHLENGEGSMAHSGGGENQFTQHSIEQQEYMEQDLDLSESSAGANSLRQHMVPDPVADINVNIAQNTPDLEISASDGILSGSHNPGDSLFSADDEEFPPRSPISSDGEDDFMAEDADEDSDDDSVF